MKRLFTLLFLVAVFVGGGTFLLFRQVGEIVLKQRAEAETAAVVEAARSARKGRIPFDWSAAAFVPAETLLKAAELTQGMKIVVPPGHGLPPDLTVEVVRMKLSSDDGFALVDLALVAKSPSQGIELFLTASGVIRYLGEETANATPEGWRNVKFGVDLIELRPDVSIGFFQFRVRNFASRLLTSALVASLGDKCAVSIPVPTLLRADMKMDGKDTFKVGDAAIGLKWELPAFQLSEKVEIAAPIFTKNGCWLLASDQPTHPKSTENWRPSLEESRKILTDALAPAPQANGHSLLWFNRTVLERFAASVNKTSPVGTAKVTSVNGPLYHEEWQFLGTGKVEVGISGVAGEGSVNIGTIVTGWKPNEGVQVAVPLVGKAKVPIHIHLDPGPTGGVGFDVGMDGSIPLSVTATLRPEVLSLAGKKALILRVTGDPQKAILEISTDGRFKCSVGSAHVAKVGAAIRADLNPKGIPPMLLFSEVPRVAKVAAQGITLAKAGIEISAAPEELSVTEDGMLLSLGLNLLPTNTEVENSEKIDEVRQACQKLAVGQPVGDTNFAVLVAGLEFSENNDVVRFFGNAIHDLTRGPGPGNEFVKAVDTVAHDLTHGLGPNNDIRKWFRSPGSETGKFLSSSAEKAAGLAEKGGKELENVGKKAKEDLLKRPGHNLNPANWKW